MQATSTGSPSARGAARRFLGVGVLLLGGCHGSVVAPEVSAAARWEARRPAAYSFVFQRVCFCLDTELVPIRLTVRNGRVVDGVPDGGTEVTGPDDPLVPRYPTIDDLHRSLVRARQRGATFEVEYHPQWPVPVSAYIDVDRRLADDEQGWRVTDFRVLPDGQ